MKIPVVNREFYVMYLEPCQDMLWFHTDIHKWTSEVKKEYLKDLESLQDLIAIPLVALVEEENTKLAKFGRSIGWIKTNQLNINDKKYDVYTRSKTWVA
jgi:hypothetical protein